MREIKFRAWEKELKEIIKVYNINFENEMINQDAAWRMFDEIVLMQYTGLKDKNGVEIYEFMEIDNMLEVQFLNGCYVLINISNNDIITLSTYLRNNNEATVTKEYTKV